MASGDLAQRPLIIHSRFCPHGEGFWLIKQISRFITGMKDVIHEGVLSFAGCPCCESKTRKERTPLRLEETEESAALSARQTTNMWRLLLGLITAGSVSQLLPLQSPRTPPTHTTSRALSHGAGWLRPLWLHSICRHSYSALYFPLISLPPLHFSKLRCNFVSLQ